MKPERTITLTESELIKAFQLWLNTVPKSTMGNSSTSAAMNAHILMQHIDQVQK